MANYIMKYKGKYRILPTLDQETNDFPRREDGSIEDADIYISCQYGNKIFTYGHIGNTKPVWLLAYIPSIGRGHNIVKAIKEKDIEYVDYVENSEEIEFKFKASDVEVVAEVMKARTIGADISPFSVKNLPKSDVEIPTEKIEEYKKIISVVPIGDLLFVSRLTNDFLDNILQKSLRNRGKRTYDYKSEMKKLKLSRQPKEYIFTKGLFDEYIDYLKKELEKIYK